MISFHRNSWFKSRNEPLPASPPRGHRVVENTQRSEREFDPSSLGDAAFSFGQNAIAAETAYQQGMALQEGLPGRRNDPAALVWFQKAAELGHAPSQCLLGIMWQDGVGVLRNRNKALHWLRLAAQQNQAEAQYRLGSMMRKGLHLPWILRSAVRLFYALDHLIHSQKPVIPWQSKAMEWLTSAAEQEHVGAQLELAELFGTCANEWGKTALWSFRAAKNGSIDGVRNLKVCLMGASLNNMESFANYLWNSLEILADEGHLQAQLVLAEIFSSKTQVDVDGQPFNSYGSFICNDDIEAYKWYTIALSQGYYPAITQRNLLEKQMSAADVSEGRRRAIIHLRLHLKML